MTKEEINRQIAEKVMGWHSFSYPFLYQWGQGHTNYDSGPWWVTEKEYAKFRVMDWNPAERIDHAWMVAEKLKEKYCEIGILYHFEDQPDDGWYCWIGYERKIKVRADTAPMAICLAALEAAKGDNGKAK